MTEETDVNKRPAMRVQYYHDAAHAPMIQQEIVRSLGFTQVGQILELTRNRNTVIELEKVPHLLRIIE